jgi:hypothetical protein
MCRYMLFFHSVKLKLYSPIAERGLFCWSLVHGHAGLHYHQRPLHAGHATLRRLPGHEYFLVAKVAAIPQHGALRLPEHADSGVQRRLPHSVSVLYNSLVARSTQKCFSLLLAVAKKVACARVKRDFASSLQRRIGLRLIFNLCKLFTLAFYLVTGSSTASSNTTCAAFNTNGINQEKRAEYSVISH